MKEYSVAVSSLPQFISAYYNKEKGCSMSGCVFMIFWVEPATLQSLYSELVEGTIAKGIDKIFLSILHSSSVPQMTGSCLDSTRLQMSSQLVHNYSISLA